MNIASDCILPGKAKHSSLIFDGHDHDDEYDYGYVEELYEKLEYINHRIDELEERLEE